MHRIARPLFGAVTAFTAAALLAGMAPSVASAPGAPPGAALGARASSTAGTGAPEAEGAAEGPAIGRRDRRSRLELVLRPQYPQRGERVTASGYHRRAKSQPITLRARRAGSDSWRTVATARATSFGSYNVTTGKWKRRGTWEFQLVSAPRGLRSRTDELRFQPRITDRWELLSGDSGGLQFAHNAYGAGPLHASDDLRVVVYALVRNIASDRPKQWAIHQRGSGSRELPLPIERACDLSANGRYLLYLAEGDTQQLRVHDLASGDHVVVPATDLEPDSWSCGWVSDDGTKVVYAADKGSLLRTRLWDATTGTIDESDDAVLPPADDGAAHQEQVPYGLSPDGRHVLVDVTAYRDSDGGPGKRTGSFQARWDTQGALAPQIAAPASTQEVYWLAGSADAGTGLHRYSNEGDESRFSGVDWTDVVTGEVRTLVRSRDENRWFDIATPSMTGRWAAYEDHRDVFLGASETILYDAATDERVTVTDYNGNAWVRPALVAADGAAMLFFGIRQMSVGEADGKRSDVYIWHRR